MILCYAMDYELYLAIQTSDDKQINISKESKLLRIFHRPFIFAVPSVDAESNLGHKIYS